MEDKKLTEADGDHGTLKGSPSMRGRVPLLSLVLSVLTVSLSPTLSQSTGEETTTVIRGGERLNDQLARFTSSSSSSSVSLYVPTDLAPDAHYELRISHSSSSSVDWRLEFGWRNDRDETTTRTTLASRSARRLLDVDKLIFHTDSEGRVRETPAEHTAVIIATATRRGVYDKKLDLPSVVSYNVALDRNYGPDGAVPGVALVPLVVVGGLAVVSWRLSGWLTQRYAKSGID